MHKQAFGIEGFARLRIKEDGKLVGDSDWVKNTITDYGLDEGFGRVMLASAGSATVAAAALGTGGAPATNATALGGIVEDNSDGRDAVTESLTTSATGAGLTLRWYGTFSSSDSHFSATHDISNIGLYASTATNAGTILSGAAYASSNLDTNQDVEYTYEWRVATTT